MEGLPLIQLDGSIYSCRNCHSHLATLDELESTYFHSSQGKAYLFKTVVNVSVGPQEDRQMTTGLFSLADISCKGCQQIVGWKYEVAHEPAQKWKEGKFILPRTAIDGEAIIYSCRNCHTHLATLDELVSTNFHGRQGKAYLFKIVENISVGPQEDRQMITGLFTLADISCNGCHQVVGWKYEVAHEPAQKWKEGKFILDRIGIDGKDVDFRQRSPGT